jgi:hypothetical protein
MKAQHATTDSCGPEPGDYLAGGVPAATYIVAYSDGFRLRAVSTPGKGAHRLIDGTWPQLRCDGFRIRRYDEVQNRRTQLIALLAITVVFTALTFGLAAPLSFDQLLCMTFSLAACHVACAVVNGFRRDFLLRRLAVSGGSGNPSSVLRAAPSS